ATLISGERIFALARGVTTLLYYALVVVAAAEWLGFVMRRFPYTRRWGEELNESGLELASNFASAVADSLPGLAVAIVIFLLARGVLGICKPFFDQVERGQLSLSWIDRYTVRATRGLVTIGVWLFALAMAYPYLPGSETDAFKGISVLLGVMLSLGSSNLVGQAVSGLILTYSRTLHVGEYVQIGDVEGTVTEMGNFAIRIRTGLGEELTLPNAMIVGTVTKNYSRTVKGEGYIVDTVMTIGYDTPWRQVHAMMVEGARRTEGILATPAPHVFQTALSDFYVEYRLVAQALASAPRPRAQVMADLHANLQDVFNENGVQIMSPHYFADPSHAKIVLPEHFNPPLSGKG
ncbi:MAG TPA: mechanosensitive ion channel, partial [Burkholderiaceae bacterium]|nr:mechanosensitive ion channel [Burkholderiaceae bacterium]